MRIIRFLHLKPATLNRKGYKETRKSRGWLKYEVILRGNTPSTSSRHTTWGTAVGAHVLSDTTLTKGLVPHKILSPQSGVVPRLKI